jgi:hypothetical protein
MTTLKGFKRYRPTVTAFKESLSIVYHRFREGNAIGETVGALQAAYTW